MRGVREADDVSKKLIKRPAFNRMEDTAVSNSENNTNTKAGIRYRGLVRHLKHMRDETMQGIWTTSAIMHIPTPDKSKIRKHGH